MVRRRKTKSATVLNRLLLAIIGIFAAVALLVSFAAGVAEALIGPSHSTLRAVVAWAVLAGIGLSVVVPWLAWRKRLRSRYRRLPELLALTPREFEEAVGAILQDSGFRHVHHVGGSGDLSADLTAIDSEGRHVVVQCKRLAPGSKIGSPDIQKFLGMTVVHHRATRGIFVTTSEFSRPAVELAKNHALDLWDGAYLSRKLESIHKSRIVKL